MGPVGEQIMEIAYDEYVKANGQISFDEWFERIAIQSEDFDEKFAEARKIYSERSAEKERAKIEIKQELQNGIEDVYMKNSEINLKELIDSISLETKLQVHNELAMINLLTELGYREDKSWTPEEDEKLSILLKSAKRLTMYQLEEIEEHIQKNGFTNIKN